jgi:hypothetical protein
MMAAAIGSLRAMIVNAVLQSFIRRQLESTANSYGLCKQ